MKDFAKTAKLHELIQTAYKAGQSAYAPYSKFKVGAAVLTADGQIYTGCNVENASFGACTCAERTAICKAVSCGQKRIKAIAVVGPAGEFTYPCGICRQIIAEFAAEDALIIIAKSPDEYIIKTIDELLPGAFKLVKTGDNQ